jgi:hypothetical protein
VFVEYKDAMVTEYFHRGIVESIYRGEKGTPLTINYRDGRKITHNNIPYCVIYTRMSFDGKLLYTGDVNIELRCYDAETMELLWENRDIHCRVIVAEDGVIGTDSKMETVIQNINDGSPNGIVEKGHQWKKSLVKLDSTGGHIQYRIKCNGDCRDLTHDHFMACLDGENYSIMRKL